MANRAAAATDAEADMRQYISVVVARQFAKQMPAVERRVLEAVASGIAAALKQPLDDLDKRLKAVETRTPGEGV